MKRVICIKSFKPIHENDDIIEIINDVVGFELMKTYMLDEDSRWDDDCDDDGWRMVWYRERCIGNKNNSYQNTDLGELYWWVAPWQIEKYFREY